jgi:cytochrome bd-type quinol oxidase subunit 1
LQQLFVLGVSAYHAEGRTMLPMTLWQLTVLVSLPILIGDLHGLNTREHQPVKLAAMEAPWDTDRRVPLTLFAISSDKAVRNYFAIVVMLGLVLLGGWLRWRGRLYDTPLFLDLVQFAAPLGFVAVTAGWCVTEVGRQPWTRLRAVAHDRNGVAVADQFRRCHLPCPLHARLPVDLALGSLAGASHRPQRAGAPSSCWSALSCCCR